MEIFLILVGWAFVLFATGFILRGESKRESHHSTRETPTYTWSKTYGIPKEEGRNDSTKERNAESGDH